MDDCEYCEMKFVNTTKLKVFASARRLSTLSLLTLATLATPTSPVTAINIVLNFDAAQSESNSFDPTGALLQPLFQHAEQFYQSVFQDTAANTTLTIDYWLLLKIILKLKILLMLFQDILRMAN